MFHSLLIGVLCLLLALGQTPTTAVSIWLFGIAAALSFIRFLIEAIGMLARWLGRRDQPSWRIEG